jgi:hypothetical protein
MRGESHCGAITAVVILSGVTLITLALCRAS